MKYYYPILAIKLHWLLTSWNSKQIVSDIFQSNIYNKFWEVNILSSVWRQKNPPFDYTKLNLRQSPVHRRLFISLRPSYCLFPHLTSREVLLYVSFLWPLWNGYIEFPLWSHQIQPRSPQAWLIWTGNEKILIKVFKNLRF